MGASSGRNTFSGPTINGLPRGLWVASGKTWPISRVASNGKPTVGSVLERQKKERLKSGLRIAALYSMMSETSMKTCITVQKRIMEEMQRHGRTVDRDSGRQTSSKPSRSQREFHETDLKKAYSSLEASLKRVRSSPRTMTTSGHICLASVMSCSLCRPWGSQWGGACVGSGGGLLCGGPRSCT